LSYAPLLRRGLYPRSRGLTRGVSEPGNDNHATTATRTSSSIGRVPMVILFSLITLAFGLIAVWCASAGQWVLAAASAALAAWMSTIAWAALRKTRA
jgi:hypothetical protein